MDIIQLSFDSPKLCECGCGQPTKPARQGSTIRGWVAGQPLRFITGHNLLHGTTEKRFWAKVNKTDGCWLWTGVVFGPGYGRIHVRVAPDRQKVAMSAHRYSYELHNGPIPDGLFVLHTCDNPSCVNPTHLWLGTQADNTIDKMNKGRHSIGESHGMAKITENDVRAMRDLYAQGGYTCVTIANLFHVSRSHAWQVLTRRTWKHIK